jgi:D-alanyl-D-alanine carboxypeptidase/D-alanyl-D-alanine-endopeptidase (penicillin-binding protein 4)
MVGRAFPSVVSWCLALCLVPAAAADRPLPPPVEQALQRAHVPQEALAAVVVDAQTGAVRLSWQPRVVMNPASLIKLATTQAALDLLGPAWTWSTPVWLQGTLRDGVLDGDLVIKGSGDPKLVLERMWLLLRRVRQMGVQEIRGDIVLDRSAFVVPETSPGEFDGEPLRPYNVRPDALMLNQKAVVLSFVPNGLRPEAAIVSEPPLAGVAIDANVPLSLAPCEDWRGALKADFGDPARIRFSGTYPVACGERQWPVAYIDPKSYNARAIEGLWRETGGRLAGTVRDGIAPAQAPSFEINSPPLADVVRDINKYSNNVMAQQLFLTLGLTQRGAGTPEAARDVMRQWLAERLGGGARDVVIDNGSGLSRDTRISAQSLAQLLSAAWASPVMPELIGSLAVSGRDGTMRRSLAPAGRAHLKTGSLRDVAGVAGYVLANNARRYVLVAIINHPNANAARPALDALVQWTAQQSVP